MICPNCQKEIDNDSRFCRHCGVEFLDDPETEIEISPDEDYPSDNVAEETDTLIPNNIPPKNTKNKSIGNVIPLLITILFSLIIKNIFKLIQLFSFFYHPDNQKVSNLNR